MAHVYRLIVGALVALALLLPGLASASFPSTPGTQWNAGACIGGVPIGGYFSTKQAACTDYGARAVATYPTYVTNMVATIEPNGTQCKVSYNNSVGTPTSCLNALGSTTAQTCPAGATLSGSTCTCNAGFVESAGSCLTTAAAAAAVCSAMNATGAVYSTGGGLSTSGCMSGFNVRGSMAVIGAGGTSLAGKNLMYPPFSCDGSTCINGAGNTTTQNAPEPCSPPKQSGTVNGVSVCLSPSSIAAPGTTSAASAPAGSASAPVSGLGGNAPPTATGSTQETVCTGSKCTTTTNFTNASGATVGTSQETKPQNTFCQDNPTSTVCIESRFAGSGCGAVDSCSGDAIQCAIQAQAKKTACAFESSAAATTEENAYTAARAVTGDQTTGPGINSTVNVSASSFDQTNLLGAEVGLSDLTVTVMGRATTLPLSGLNTWFDVLGKLLMGVTAILCMRIVARG